jgi:hypothetical protein
MDIRTIEDLLNRLERVSREIEAQQPSTAAYTAQIREISNQIRTEVAPPPDDVTPRTRDQISPKEWAEYEWQDVTSFGDRQRKYLRGLKR